jgi:hypothetical protein
VQWHGDCPSPVGWRFGSRWRAAALRSHPSENSRHGRAGTMTDDRERNSWYRLFIMKKPMEAIDNAMLSFMRR